MRRKKIRVRCILSTRNDAKIGFFKLKVIIIKNNKEGQGTFSSAFPASVRVQTHMSTFHSARVVN